MRISFRQKFLINNGSTLGLIYILFNYWITPLYIFLDKVFFNSENTQRLSLYGSIEYIPWYLIYITFTLLFINLITNIKKEEKRMIPINLKFFSSNLDITLSILIFFFSLFISLNSVSDYRYSNSAGSGLFDRFNLARSIIPYFVISIWYVRGKYIINDKKKFIWYFNTILYSLSALLTASGLGSILIFFAWIHQLLNKKTEYNFSLIQLLKFNLIDLLRFRRKIKIFSMVALILLVVSPYIIFNTILIGHKSKIDKMTFNRLEDATTERGINLNYYIENYLLKIGINRPEFYTVYKSPSINSDARKINRIEFFANFKYRLGKLTGNKSNQKEGKTPSRTNLINIANYQYRQSEGTSPGLLSSFNYYFPSQISILCESIYFILVCTFFALFENLNLNRFRLEKFLIVFFILREFMASPISTITILDHSIIIPILLIFYAVFEDTFTVKKLSKE